MKFKDRDFFKVPAAELAPQLLGKILVHRTDDGVTSGMIVETEAYEGGHDLASHAARGETPRSKIMFGESGVSYVYFTYGMHYCFNVVCDKAGTPGAVLIRALQPIDGIDLMKKRRQKHELTDLCSGPAKLCEAMGISLHENGENLFGKKLYFEIGENIARKKIASGPRIGIRKSIELPWRFWLKDNPHVSR